MTGKIKNKLAQKTVYINIVLLVVNIVVITRHCKVYLVIFLA